MKTTTILSALGILMTTQVAMSGEDIATKFSKQEGWRELEFSNENNYFRGYETDKGTIRVNMGRVDFQANSKIIVKGNVSWSEVCADYMSFRDYSKQVSEVKLVLTQNPLGPNYTYSSSGGVISLGHKSIENAPKVNKYKLKVRSYTPVVHISPNVSSIESELNQQLEEQAEAFHQGQGAVIDLSGQNLKRFACDLSRGFAKLDMQADVVLEPARLERLLWVTKLEFKNIFEELKKLTPDAPLSLFGAGISLGKVLQKVKYQTKTNINLRDEKFLKGFFEEKDGYRLKNLSESELKEEFIKTPELIIPASLQEEGALNVKLDITTHLEGN